MSYALSLHEDHWICMTLQTHFHEDDLIQDGGACRSIILEKHRETLEETLYKKHELNLVKHM